MLIQNNHQKMNFVQADFRNLSQAFTEHFDIVIAMDNALPHMLSRTNLEKAINSIIKQIEKDIQQLSKDLKYIH